MTFQTVVSSTFLTLTANYEAFTDGTDALVLTLTPRETGILTFNVDSVGTTTDIEIAVWQGLLLTTGTLDLDTAASTTDVELMTASDPIATDDDLNGTYIVMTGGTSQGEVRLITDSIAADDGIVPSHAYAAVAAADTYHRYSLDQLVFTLDATTAIGSDNPMSKGFGLHGASGQKVIIAARSATDAHRIQMHYQADGVSA